MPTVKIAMSCSNAFVPIFTVCLYSLAENLAPGRKCELVVLQTDISAENRQKIASAVEKFTDLDLRYLDMTNFLQNSHVRAAGNVPVQTYFRLLLPYALPEWDKAVFLDSDLIIQKDVGILYDQPMEGARLLAAHDADGTAQFNGSLPWMRDYGKKVLHMQDQTQYFQAGVLVMDLAALRRSCTLETVVRLAEKQYIYCDQDVLNQLHENFVHYLDMRWNVMMDCGGGRKKDVLAFAPPAHAQAYLAAREDPWIIHFAGEPKPWQQAGVDFEAAFWQYAEACGEEPALQEKMCRSNSENGGGQYYSPAHRLMQKVLPPGSMRRTLADRICPPESFPYKTIKNVYHKLQMNEKRRCNHW